MFSGFTLLYIIQFLGVFGLCIIQFYPCETTDCVQISNWCICTWQLQAKCTRPLSVCPALFRFDLFPWRRNYIDPDFVLSAVYILFSLSFLFVDQGQLCNSVCVCLLFSMHFHLRCPAMQKSFLDEFPNEVLFLALHDPIHDGVNSLFTILSHRYEGC